MKRMGRFLAGLLVGLLLGGVLGHLGGRFTMKSPERVVREPQKPGEAQLAYTPPEPATVSLEMVRANTFLASMLKPKLWKLSETLYAATGYALGNVAVVVTPEGLVVIDTTESLESAREILAAVREISPLPVRCVIYTHSHLDHVMGAKAFVGPETQVIASSRFPEVSSFQHELLQSFQLSARANQGGKSAEGFGFPLPIDRSPLRGLGRAEDIVPPTILVDEPYTFTLGGMQFEVFRTSGETSDHLAVWLPGQRALMVGDLYYHSFPNLSTPMLEPRPVLEWARSVERFEALEPAILVPGHTTPLEGAPEIADTLKHYAEAIRYVHDATVRCINEGKTVEQAVAEVRLPQALAALPYLQEQYGRVPWAVRGLYQGYTGWYDGRGTALHPLPTGHRARELVALAGVDRVLRRAIALQQQKEHQLAIELCDLVIDANPDDPLARRIKAASLQQLAYSYNNLNAFGFYRSAYALEMQAVQAAPSASSAGANQTP